MIIQCEGCASRYYLPESKVPTRTVKVRCPQCKAVFRLSPPTPKVVATAQPAVVSSHKGAAVRSDGPTVVPTAPKPIEEAPVAASATALGAARANTKDVRAKRLARVLVSDILCYNQAKRDQALIDGTLMAVLGDEIKKSWELYKEKVGPEVATSTDYFKEALNEILADGQKVF